MSESEHTFVLTPGPHLHAAESTAKIMWWVNGALAPAALWGAWVFGLTVGWVRASQPFASNRLPAASANSRSCSATRCGKRPLSTKRTGK